MFCIKTNIALYGRILPKLSPFSLHLLLIPSILGIAGILFFPVDIHTDNNSPSCQILEGHTETVTSVAFSPPLAPYGEILASGSNDKTIRIWNPRTGELVRVFEGHKDEVKSIAFYPNGRAIASVSWSGMLRVWNMISGELLMSLDHKVVYKADKGLSRKNAILWSVAVSPNDRMIATVGQYRKDISALIPVSRLWSGTVRLWDSLSGKPLRILEWQEDAVYTVAFSPDGRILATGSADKTILFWDLQTNGPLRTLEGHNGAVYSIAFSKDGKFLVSGSADKTVKIWNVHTGELIRTLEGHKDAVLSVDFSPNGKMIASGSRDSTIQIWDSQTGRQIMTLEGHEDSVTRVAFSPDSDILASGSVDKTVRLWKLK